MKHIPKLLAYLKPYKRWVWLYLLWTLGATVFSLFTFGMLAPVMQVLFTDSRLSLGNSSSLVGRVTEYVNGFILRHDKLTALTYSVVIVVVFTILKNLFLYLGQLTLNPLNNMVVRRLRDDLYAKTLALPIGFFTDERKGDLMSRMTNDVSEVEVSIISLLQSLIREPITIILTLLSMVLISPQLTLFLLLFLPLAGWIIGSVSKTLKKPSSMAQEQLGQLMTNMDETIAGMRVVKAFNAERHQQSRFRSINNLLFRTKNKIAARRDAGSPLSETLGILVVCIILWYGGYLIFSEKATTLTGPFFIMFIGLFYQIINPAKNLSTAFYNMQKGAAALDRIQELMQAPIVIAEKEHAVVLQGFNNEIELRDVGFKYGDKEILKHINLTIKKGQTVALVGASGAGKSTIADLIPRFHDVSSGAILIDGVDVRDVALYSYRRLIGMVSQEPILFNDTIANNILLGTGGKTMEDVATAARIANAERFVLKKANGYNTEVGDRGSRLSGGERQRVTVARAVLKNPPILILDEATSALDTESEQLVQEAINNLMRERTCIVIAHRLSTIQHADLIVVMSDGEIVERGTHASLMAMEQGSYRQLVGMQQLK